MTKLEKAQKQLDNIGISTVITNDTLYVCIDDVQLELAEFEINFRAEKFDEEEKENDENE